MSRAEDEDDYGYNLSERSKSTLSRIHKTCEAMVQFAVTSDPHARQLLGAMEGSGCPLSLGHGVYCEDCPRGEMGRFRFRPMKHSGGVVICQNNNRSQSLVTRSVIHELTHAFDHCLGRVDWKSLKHLACAEVRAYNLSGECLTERCVQEQAVLSVLHSGSLFTRDEAEKAVAEVLDTCLGDRTPLGSTPHGEKRNAFREL